MTEIESLRGKAAVLQYLAGANEAAADALIVLFVDEAFHLLGRIEADLRDTPRGWEKMIVVRALETRAAGVIVVENFASTERGSEFWRLRRYRRLKSLLEERECFLLDVLVISRGQIRSRTGLRDAVMSDRSL